MKKYVLVVSFLFTATTFITAQTPTVKLPTSASTGFDVKGIANSIMGKLGPLALTAAQNPQVLSTVTDFLTKKSGILGLAKSAPTEYATKFAGLNSNLLGSLKTILTASQYTKFLGLKPKTNDVTNPLSHLFF